MVSSEGACAAYFHYRRAARERRRRASPWPRVLRLDAELPRAARPRRHRGARPRRRRARRRPASSRRSSRPPSATRTSSRSGDGAVVTVGSERLAFTTDTFVVKPAFFPGRRHRLAGRPRHRQRPRDVRGGAALPERGLPPRGGLPDAGPRARRGVDGRGLRARSACRVVTGDTKVVDRGKGDGIYVNTSGIGRVRDGVSVGPGRAAPGDAVLVSGPVGDHGIAVMAAREGIDFETALVSDSRAGAWLRSGALLDAVPETHVLRDPTRGGLATALCEIAALLEGGDPPRGGRRSRCATEVRGACELLGFDPLYVACEGRFLAIVPGGRADAALAAIRSQAGRRGRAAHRRRWCADDPGRARPADPHRQPPPARAALRRAAAADLLRPCTSTRW